MIRLQKNIVVKEKLDTSILNKEHSKILSVSDAEKFIGKRPVLVTPQPPTSENPRPETLKKYNKELDSYNRDLENLNAWEEEYDLLLDLNTKLLETRNVLEDLKNKLNSWGALNIGNYIVRNDKDKNKYSKIQNLDKVVDDVESILGIPQKITSLSDEIGWYLQWSDDIVFKEIEFVFPQIYIEVGDSIKYTLFSIPEDLNIISDSIEFYIDSIQPKNIKYLTNVQLDRQSEVVLNSWVRNNITNSTLPHDEIELKLYISSMIFLKEIENLKKYPQFSSLGKMVIDFLE